MVILISDIQIKIKITKQKSTKYKVQINHIESFIKKLRCFDQRKCKKLQPELTEIVHNY